MLIIQPEGLQTNNIHAFCLHAFIARYGLEVIFLAMVLIIQSVYAATFTKIAG
jgi:hypothetical protein